jgi:hypothetical protein
MTSKKKERKRKGTPLSRVLRGETRVRAVAIGETILVLTEARTVLDLAAEGLKDWLHPVEWDNLRVLSNGMYRVLRMLEVLLARNLGRVLSDPIHIGLPCEAVLAAHPAPDVAVVRAEEESADAESAAKAS